MYASRSCRHEEIGDGRDWVGAGGLRDLAAS